MTDTGSTRPSPDSRPGSGDESGEDGAFHFTDKRRIDPDTGKVRGSDAAPDADGDSSGDLSADGAAAPGESAPDESAASGELAAAQAEAAERTADLQRLSAEYANYRKRTDREKKQASVTGKSAVVSELLTVLDDVDRADEHGDLTGGFKTVAEKLTGALQGLGLSRFGEPGDEFDPEHHEAVQFDTSAEVDHPTVTTVLRVGYEFDERVLRPAVVLVTGPEEGSASAGAQSDGAGPDSQDADGDSGSDSDGDSDSDGQTRDEPTGNNQSGQA